MHAAIFYHNMHIATCNMRARCILRCNIDPFLLNQKGLESMSILSGALVLAKTLPPQFTPRSKYYAIKTIWFREEIFKRDVQLLKIDTAERLGDIFTKGLTRFVFEYLRRR
jgi:hypothetical protein